MTLEGGGHREAEQKWLVVEGAHVIPSPDILPLRSEHHPHYSSPGHAPGLAGPRLSKHCL